MKVRPATHAGSWYSDNPTSLEKEIEPLIKNSVTKPVRDNKIIVCPHAGYRYCGKTLSHSYASLYFGKHHGDIRIFILGPSHHKYFENFAYVSGFDSIATPLGELTVDTEYINSLIKSHNKLFKKMPEEIDEMEHCLEMQFPILLMTLKLRGIDLNKVKIVPMLISHNDDSIEQEIANILCGEIVLQDHYFIISSDFCHWGRRFQYTGYIDDVKELEEALDDETEIEHLTSRSKLNHHEIKIWESIKLIDKFGMEVIKKCDYSSWENYLSISGNTICGQNPLSVIIRILQHLKNTNFEVDIEWIDYSQSNQINNFNDSSVSYGSGYMKIKK